MVVVFHNLLVCQRLEQGIEQVVLVLRIEKDVVRVAIEMSLWPNFRVAAGVMPEYQVSEVVLTEQVIQKHFQLAAGARIAMQEEGAGIGEDAAYLYNPFCKVMEVACGAGAAVDGFYPFAGRWCVRAILICPVVSVTALFGRDRAAGVIGRVEVACLRGAGRHALEDIKTIGNV